jgi:hypothetical protein
VPFYNTLQLIWIVKKPWWWILLMLIPFVNIVIFVIFYNEVSKAFGKGTGFTVLLIVLPLIGFPMLAFGSAKYQLGHVGAGTSGQGQQPMPPAVPPVQPAV